jgi:hypothetical protein
MMRRRKRSAFITGARHVSMGDVRWAMGDERLAVGGWFRV